MEVYISVKQACEFEGINEESLWKRIQRGKIEVIEDKTNRRIRYLVNLSSLSTQAIAEYHAQKNTELDKRDLQKIKAELEARKYGERYAGLSLEDLTDKQREQIVFWKNLISGWRNYIEKFPGQNAQKTQEFLEIVNTTQEKPVTEKTLRRKYTNYKRYGEIALADDRSMKRERKSSIPEVAWNIFLEWWLDESEPSVTHIYDLVKIYLEDNKMCECLPLPSRITFQRATKKIPVAVVKYFRHGEKTFTDEVLPYVQRFYDGIRSNEIWTSDYHTLDFFVKDDLTGKVFRPHVVVWQDIRSRKILSLRVCESSNSHGVVNSFREACMTFGLPHNIYVDNGREYLVRDFGGRGRRKTNPNAQMETTILQVLDIKMINAKVANGRAKVAERTFKQLAGEFSKLFLTYCGNRPENRPQRHNDVMKNEKNIPLLSEVTKDLQAYVDGWYNMKPSNGEGMNGKSPNEVYAENLISKRTATQEQINLLTMRSSRMQTVKRNGVYLDFGQGKIWFYNTDLVHDYMNRKVYVRYNSEDLSEVRIEDEKGRLLCTAERLGAGGYDMDADLETVKKVQRLAKEQKAKVKDFKQAHQADVGSALETMLNRAKKNMDNDHTSYDASILEPLTFENKPEARAVGDGGYDLDLMIKNAKKNRGMKE
ncbi:MAG TPA: Mu transposase C-terminal domain-containing protein [Firmicutes bacterium]|nr:Mu transposase C-terminal domain-containing protein [Bacillota bacterium]